MRKSISIGTFLATVCIGASAVAAPTYENNPGASCVGSGTGELTVTNEGEAQNQTNWTVTAVCPAERPIGAGELQTELSGKVFVVDQHPWSNVCCRAISKNPSGATQYGSWECSSGDSSGYQVLDVDPVTDNYTWSHFMLQCMVPPMRHS